MGKVISQVEKLYRLNLQKTKKKLCAKAKLKTEKEIMFM